MAELFSERYALLWAVALAVALFFPVRQLVWVLSVRRAERDGRRDEERRRALRRRAALTAGLVALVFSYFYTRTLFSAG